MSHRERPRAHQWWRTSREEITLGAKQCPMGKRPKKEWVSAELFLQLSERLREHALLRQQASLACTWMQKAAIHCLKKWEGDLPSGWRWEVEARVVIKRTNVRGKGMVDSCMCRKEWRKVDLARTAGVYYLFEEEGGWLNPLRSDEEVHNRKAQPPLQEMS